MQISARSQIICIALPDVINFFLHSATTEIDFDFIHMQEREFKLGLTGAEIPFYPYSP